MNFISDLVQKVGGETAVNLINDQVTPLILNNLKPNIQQYVNSHVERTRGELFQQLPKGVYDVLDDILPDGLNRNNNGGGNARGLGDDARGFMEDIQNKIREKIEEILNSITEKVRQIVSEVTGSTTNRATDSVVDIAKSKLKLGAKREVEFNNNNNNVSTRGFGDSSNNNQNNNNGDFIDNFINSSLNDIRPLVRGELKGIYQSILELVPQDARRILCAIVPGLEDNNQNQNQNQNQQFSNNSNNQQFSNNNFNQGQQFYNNGNNYNNQSQQYGNDNYNQGQQFNNNNQAQGSFNNSRGIEENNPNVTSRGLFSDIKNFAHQVKDEMKQSGMGSLIGKGNSGSSSRELLDEFQNKARAKVDVITTKLMEILEDKIMNTVGQELSSLAKNKLNSLKF
ncbi:hypothetical protein K502DRAFT_323064 [Neoconidiobolus thromboides FSU 785]|nr:hypothetical protein K502DRAFT_323064 [Neoconidiobolus thromboides FSU 785]